MNTPCSKPAVEPALGGHSHSGKKVPAWLASGRDQSWTCVRPAIPLKLFDLVSG
jgi:hypothetical protein